MANHALKPSTIWILNQPADMPAKDVVEAAPAAGFEGITKKVVYQARSTHRNRARKRRAAKKAEKAQAEKTTAKEALKVARAAAVRPGPMFDPLAVDALRRLAIRYGTTSLRAALEQLESE